MQLTERQKKFLRREAHNLKPVVSLGDKGITPALVKELNGALEHHELIKIKVRAGDREARDAAIAELAESTRAVLISRVGNIAALYRPNRKDPKLKLPAPGA
jgi:RNA-binding protein